MREDVTWLKQLHAFYRRYELHLECDELKQLKHLGSPCRAAALGGYAEFCMLRERVLARLGVVEDAAENHDPPSSPPTRRSAA